MIINIFEPEIIAFCDKLLLKYAIVNYETDMIFSISYKKMEIMYKKLEKTLRQKPVILMKLICKFPSKFNSKVHKIIIFCGDINQQAKKYLTNYNHGSRL